MSYNIIDNLTPLVCLEFAALILEWLDRRENNKSAKLVFPFHTRWSYDVTHCINTQSFMAIHNMIDDEEPDVEAQSVTPRYISGWKSAEKIDLNNMSESNLLKVLEHEPSAISKIANPSFDVQKYILEHAPEYIKDINNLTGELCDYFYHRGTHIRTIPRRFITDKMIHNSWTTSWNKCIPYNLVKRDDKINILLKGPYGTATKLVETDKMLGPYIVRLYTGILTLINVDKEYYQRLAKMVCKDNPSSLILVSRDKCSDYYGLCELVLEKDPTIIRAVTEPPFYMASEAMAISVRGLGQSKLYTLMPGGYRKYPEEFLEAWPHCIMFQDFDEETWLEMIPKHPHLFLRCPKLTERIIRLGIECNKGEELISVMGQARWFD